MVFFLFLWIDDDDNYVDTCHTHFTKDIGYQIYLKQLI